LLNLASNRCEPALTERLSKTANMPAHPKARTESWLVGAVLMLFGVAVAAAMPQISAAVRGAVADAANSGQGADTAQRPVLRLRLLAVRLIEPKASDGQDDLVPQSIFVSVLVQQAVAPSHAFDLAGHIRARGIRARAPPALRA
jgi:hypothetical protein